VLATCLEVVVWCQRWSLGLLGWQYGASDLESGVALDWLLYKQEES
jgi:hypothetical protein